MFAGDNYKKEVEQDIREAQELGIDTVPTFLFNRRQAIIGSEPIEHFLNALNNAYQDWKHGNSPQNGMEVKKGK